MYTHSYLCMYLSIYRSISLSLSIYTYIVIVRGIDDSEGARRARGIRRAVDPGTTNIA